MKKQRDKIEKVASRLRNGETKIEDELVLTSYRRDWALESKKMKPVDRVARESLIRNPSVEID